MSISPITFLTKARSTLRILSLVFVLAPALAGCISTIPPMVPGDIDDIDISGTYRATVEETSSGEPESENIRITRVDTGVFVVQGQEACAYLYTLQMPGRDWLVLSQACGEADNDGYYFLARWIDDGFVMRLPKVTHPQVFIASASRFGIDAGQDGSLSEIPNALALRTLLSEGVSKSYMHFETVTYTFRRIPDDPGTQAPGPFPPPQILPSSEAGAAGMFAFDSIAEPIADPLAPAPQPVPSRP